ENPADEKPNENPADEKPNENPNEDPSNDHNSSDEEGHTAMVLCLKNGVKRSLTDWWQPSAL
ncbi:hypothetical protein AAJ76_740001, partial [Vairimorpha ceranae]